MLPIPGLLFALLLQVATEEPAFRANVNLVHVDVEVRHNERIVEGLSKSDFQVTENGRVQPILSIASQEEPLDIILLLDTSFSMKPVVARVAEAARTALAQLRADDRIAVMAFDRAPELIADFTSNYDAVERTIRERVLTRRFPMNTQIQRAADGAALHFLRTPRTSNRRRAVLIVTDNLGMQREGQALPHLWEADAVLVGIIVRSVSMSARYSVFFPPSLVGVGGMTGLADKTGGDTIKMDDAGEGLRKMIQRVRLRYSLYYAMPETKPGDRGKERKIRVELTPDVAKRYRDAKVRARAGYRVP